MLLAISLCCVVFAGDLTRERYAHIEAIRISEMAYKGDSLDTILFALICKIESLDPSPGGPHKMSIVDSGFKPEQKLPLADFTARKVSVKDVIQDLSRIFGVTFHATSIGIVVTPDGAKPFPNYKAEVGTVFYTYSKSPSEQVGAGQPATVGESKPDGKDKPQPESEPAPR